MTEAEIQRIIERKQKEQYRRAVAVGHARAKYEADLARRLSDAEKAAGK